MKHTVSTPWFLSLLSLASLAPLALPACAGSRPAPAQPAIGEAGDDGDDDDALDDEAGEAELLLPTPAEVTGTLHLYHLDDLLAVASDDEQVTLGTATGGESLIVNHRSNAGHVAGVGMLFAYQVTELRWDGSTNELNRARSWTCDETETDGECPLPAWAVTRGDDVDAAVRHP